MKPWIPHLAREYLEQLMLPHWRCFEWGSGGSTLWMAARCKTVVSVEHDPAWQLEEVPPNVEQRIILPKSGELGSDTSDPSHFRSSALGGVNFREYAGAIGGEGPFDLVLVDGRARPSCLKCAIPEIGKGGWLALDNAERPWYALVDLPEDWDSVRFRGTGPPNEWRWEFALWRRP